MRQIVARRIHGLMRTAGPTLKWRAARGMWFKLPGFNVGATHPKFAAARRRAAVKGRRHTFGTLRMVAIGANAPSYHRDTPGTHRNGFRPHAYVPMQFRHMHVCAGYGNHTSRKNAGRGPKWQKEMLALANHIKVAMLNQQTRANQQRRAPKVYPTSSVRAMTRHRNMGRGV